MYGGTRCAVEADWSEDPGGVGERGESVNDMYTQTGRAGRKEGKTPRKTKRERERKRGGEEEPGNRGRKKSRRRRNSRLKCLGFSDDSQSSCLLASRFPFPSTPPAVCVRTSFLSLSLSLSASSPLSLPPLSPHPRLRLCVSLFCSSRTHRCGTSIVLKLFHLLAPPHRARPVFVTRRS